MPMGINSMTTFLLQEQRNKEKAKEKGENENSLILSLKFEVSSVQVSLPSY